MIKIAKVFGFAFVLIAIVSCSDKNATKKDGIGYSIDGNVPGTISKTAYLFDNNNKQIDSSAIDKNRFNFSGISDTVQFVFIQLKKDNLSIPFVLENENYQVYATSKRQLVFGGKAQQSYNNYIEVLDQLKESKALIIREYKNINSPSLKRLNKSLDSINSTVLNYKLDAINSISYTPIKIEIVKELLNSEGLNLDIIKQLQQKVISLNKPELSAMIQLKQEYLNVKELKKEVNKTKKVVKRQMAPLFTGESLNGSDLELSSVLNGKKVVLLDFWASWCGPCRQVTPQIRSLYMRYKDKGFDIITISEDKNRDAWKNGLVEDNILHWNHIYDDNMRIAYMFNVSSIPHMVLLDENGGIIDRKVSFSRLSRELARICK